MTLADHSDLLASIRTEWNKAEKSIKIAEQIAPPICNPAIYELRYAGRRMVEALALDPTEIEKTKRLLADALFNCHRARHDAIDASTLKIAGDLNAAMDNLGRQHVLPSFPKAPELLTALAKVRKLIAHSRENREDRDSIYASIETEDLQGRLFDLYDEFRASEPLMIAAVQAQLQREEEQLKIARKQQITTNISVWTAIISVLITLATLALPIGQMLGILPSP